MLLYWPDAVVSLMGQTLRQGWIEANYKLALMIVLIPWLKYFINTNPMIYKLDERFTQQISTSCADMQVQEVHDCLRLFPKAEFVQRRAA